MKMMFKNVSTYDKIKLFLEINNCQFTEEYLDKVVGINWQVSNKENILKLHTENIISEVGLKSIYNLGVGDTLCFIYCEPIISNILHLKYNTKEK